MKKHSDTIIINGKHYNARTGHALESEVSLAKAPKNVDGILPQHVSPAVLAKPVRAAELTSSVKQPVMDIARTPAKHLPKRHTQPGATLMRSALTKPQPSLKRTTKVLVANQAKAKVSVANLKPKTSAAVVDSHKLARAQQINKSKLVKRFTPLYGPAVASQLQAVAAQRLAVTEQVAKNIANHRPSRDMFERALATAVSHEQATPPHVHKALKKGSRQRRLRNLSASTLAVLLIAGFVGYQNLPSMKFQYVSSRAGFQAQLPGYRPSGFSVGNLSYQTGAVSVKFHSNSDSRSFAITQQPSAWDSQTLRENFVAQNNQEYHTTSAAGRTVYVYGDNNATWVNGGVWYNIETNGSLTERQLTQLASSL